MSGVTRIGHMGMRVRDLDAAVEFQAAVLGLVETERRGRVAYLTCNERHHELILIESGRRGYDHIGLEVADADALERARAAIAAAGGELLGAIYDGEPGIDRAALVRGPGGHVYKLFCGMESGRRAAGRRPADPLRARLGQGPQPRPDRALPRPTASASPSPTAWAGPRAGGTATPTTTGWR